MQQERGLFGKKRTALRAPTSDPPLMRALEPRILLDAAGVETAQDAIQSTVHSSLADAYAAENFLETTLEAPAGPSEETGVNVKEFSIADVPLIKSLLTSEIAFITSDVPNIDTLIAGMPAGTEVVIIDAQGDGIAQIAEALAYRSGIDAIHLFSHGDQGSLSLGTSELTIESMQQVYRAQLAMIGDALGPDGDILIYGCDFAGGEVGLIAAELLAELTGADIAASTDLTGSSELGGDWDLEINHGDIEAEVLEANAAWVGVLAEVVHESYDVSFAQIDHDERIGNTRSVGQIFTNTSAGATYNIDQVDLALKIFGAPPAQNVVVTLREIAPLPTPGTGTILATATLSSASLGAAWAWHSLALDSTVTLDSGTEYVLMFETDGASTASDSVQVGVQHDGAYAGGNAIDRFGLIRTTPPAIDATLFRVVENVNSPPVATGGSVSTPEDTAVTIDASEFGFTDVEGDALQSVTITNLNLQGGTLTHSAGGTTVVNNMTVTLAELADLEYTPALNSTAGASFNYSVNDAGTGVTINAMVITVTAANDVPVATGGSVATIENTDVIIGPTEFGFTDIEGDALQSVTTTNLLLGGGTLTHSSGATTVTDGMTVTLAELADLTFSPAANSTANVSFDYTVNDVGAGVVDSTMSIAVDFDTLEVHDVSFANIVDNEDFGSDRTVGQSFEHVTSGGTPYQVDQIDVVIRKDSGAPLQNITISVRNTFDGPVIASGTISSAGVGTSYSWNSIVLDTPAVLHSGASYVFTFETDDPSRKIELGVESADEYVAGSFIKDDGSIQPDKDALFRILGSEVVAATNNAPVISSNGGGASATVNANEEGTAVTTVTAPDGDFDPLSFSIIGGADANRFTIDLLSGELTFNNPPNFEAPSSNAGTNTYEVQVAVTDGQGGNDIQDISVAVQDVNDWPNFVPDGPVIAIDVVEGNTAVVDLDAADEDLPGDTLVYSIVSGDDFNRFNINSVTGELSLKTAWAFDNPFDFNSDGTYEVIVAVSDGVGGFDLQGYFVTVTEANQEPIATGGAVTTSEDTAVTIDASEFNFTDVEGDPLQSVTITNLNLNGGTLTHSAGGTTVVNNMTVTLAQLADLVFTPALNSTAGASFDYTVNDSELGTVTAAMVISVTAENDAPTGTAAGISTPEDTAQNGVVVMSDVDAGDTPDATLGTPPANGTAVVNPDGTYTYTPNLNYVGSDSFTVTVTDDGGLTATVTVNVSVTAENNAPVATGGTVSTIENGSVTIGLSAFGYSDVEGDSLQSVTITNLALNGGTLTHSDGAIVVTNGMVVSAAQLHGLEFVPAPDTNGIVSFDYIVNDGNPGIMPATINIIVSAAPPPVIPVVEPTPAPEPEIEVAPEPAPEPVSLPKVEIEEIPEPAEEPTAETPVPAPPEPVEPTPVAPVAEPPRPPVVVAPKPVAPAPAPPAPEPPAPQPAPPKPEEPPQDDIGFTQVDKKEFGQQLDKLRDDLESSEDFSGVKVDKVTFAFGSVLSVGSVVWVLRGGALAAAFLAALPVWNRFDPITIVTGRKDKNDDAEPTDADLMYQSVCDAQSRVKEESFL